MRAPWLVIGFIFSFSVFLWSAWPDINHWLVNNNFANTKAQGQYGRASVKFSEVVVDSSVPLTASLKRQGLAGRTGLGSHEGMLFVFDSADRYAFWMNGMLIPLDIIWINHNQVVDISVNIPPPSFGQKDLPIYRPNLPASAALEVAAGFSASHNIKIGDEVRIDRN